MNYPVLKAQPSSTERSDKIYLVTHAELTVGHQITQTAHVIAELAVAHPEHFSKWHNLSQSIIVLQTPCSESLFELYVRAQDAMLAVEAFREPDLGDEITALAFLPHADNVRFLANLSLAGKRLPSDDLKASENTLRRISLRIQDTFEFQQGRYLRECYFAFIDHLKGRINLREYGWDIPEYSGHERQELLATQPASWVVDRALTFFFADRKDLTSYYDDQRILTLLDQPQTIAGWEVVMSAFTSKESTR